ncbi:MAG TPA: thioredoxin domain-containing protein [Bryobacteraceae bacterium]|jgi:protein-disulfide isomerase
MIDKHAVLSALALAACATASAAAQPALLKAGVARGGDGWKFAYSAMAKPPLAPGQDVAVRAGASHTDVPGRPPVFHRFFVDPVNRIYFGYDLVILATTDPGHARSTVRFQPLSLHTDQLPDEYQARTYHVSGTPKFPSETFQTGQTIGVDVLQNPASGMKVVDYITVSFEPDGSAHSKAANGVAKVVGNPNAPVCMDLYSDFQCPSCKVFHDTALPVIMKDYVATGKVYIVSHEFPLAMHPHAREAAGLATAAARVGKYQAVGDALFRDQAKWAESGKLWDTLATVLTPEEQAKVKALANDPSVLGQVQQDMDLARSLKINQTPTVFVSRGQKRYPFPGPSLNNYTLLKSLIDDLLK